VKDIGVRGPHNAPARRPLAEEVLLAPIVLIVIAPALMIVGAAIGPETREAELHLPDLGGVSQLIS